MNKNVYEMVNEFIKKYPMTIAWRLKTNLNIFADMKKTF